MSTEQINSHLSTPGNKKEKIRQEIQFIEVVPACKYSSVDYYVEQFSNIHCYERTIIYEAK